MILTNELRVPADPDSVFTLLNDPQRVVVCLPGATLLRSDQDTHEGRVRIKVGPVTANYEGTVRFVEADPDARRIRLSARGHDTKGNGDAEATVSIAVEDADGGSRVAIETDLVIRGRLAQFGKGAIGPVSKRLLDQFESNLQQLVAQHPQDADTAPAASPAPSTVPAASASPARTEQGAANEASSELDALAVLLGPRIRQRARSATLAGLGAVGGYLLGRALTIERFYRSLDLGETRRRPQRPRL